MHRVELLIFDLDGTLADTKHDIATAVNLTLRDLGLPEKEPAVIHGFVGGGIRRLIGLAVQDEAGERYKRAMRIFRGHYLDHLMDTTKLYPGIARVLEHFKSKKKAVVTNKAQVYTDRIMAGLGVAARFDLILGGDNGLPLKPDPQMILKVLSTLVVPSEKAVMIGDSVIDIQAARTAGVAVCAVGYGLSDPEELRQARPEYFCESAEALTGLFG